MLIDALAIGMSEEEFWNMTPHRYELRIKGYKRCVEQKRDYDNYIAYLNGIYVLKALNASVGNMFSKKGAKPIEYPDKPIDLNPNRELTEEEKEEQRLAFLDNLKLMQANFERNHKDSKA